MSEIAVKKYLSDAKRRLGLGISPKQMISRLMHDLGHLADECQSEEIVWIYVKLGYLNSILSLSFARSASQKILSKVDEEEIPDGIKEMLKSEIPNLDSDSFDADYLLKISKVSKDFTTFKNIGEIQGEDLKKEYLSKTTSGLLKISGNSCAEVRAEIMGKLDKLIDDVQQAPTGDVVKKFNDSIEALILNLRKEYFGWRQ